jgi:hypothetical protein
MGLGNLDSLLFEQMSPKKGPTLLTDFPQCGIMAEKSIYAAKVILLAVQLATKGDITTLRSLTATYPKALRTEIILRILLTYLPETLETSAYVSFLQELASGELSANSILAIDPESLNGITNGEASKKARKLHLLQLAWPDAPLEIPDDPFVLFLIHRAYRVDKEAGLLTQLPALFNPFLERSQFLRTWMISTLLPLLRLNYEYHPQNGAIMSLSDFESMNDEDGIEFLLSRTAKYVGDIAEVQETVARDLRGLVGPWMYGDTRWKRRKLQTLANLDNRNVVPIDLVQAELDHKRTGWEEVFRWIILKTPTTWTTSVEAIEKWDGPGDIDIGGYGDGTIWLAEHEQRRLEEKYARTALAVAYLIPESSTEALMGVQRILSRMVVLLDYGAIPSLPDAAEQLLTIPSFPKDNILSSDNTSFLRARMFF